MLASEKQTGMYYLRTKAAVNAIQYTVEQQGQSEAMAQIPSAEGTDSCLSCSS